MCALKKREKIAVIIAVTYKPPDQAQDFETEMYKVLRLSFHNNESVLLGDFNLPQIECQVLKQCHAECLIFF